MKKRYISTLLISCLSVTLQAQTVLFNEDFESVNTSTVAATITNPPITIYGGDIPSGWAQVNVDGYDQHVTSSTTMDNFMGMYAYRVLDNPALGSKAAYTRSSPDNIGISTLTDDILRTPLITIPASSGNATLSFKLLASGFDSLNVYASTANSLSAGASLIFKKTSSFSSTSFSTYTADLSAFQGQAIYIFFEAYDKVYNSSSSSNNAGALYIDDVKVTADLNTGINSNSSEIQLSVYPNPFSNSLYINSNLSPESCIIKITDLNGKIVSNTEIVLENNLHLNMSELKPGYYTVAIKSASFTAMYKLVKVPSE